MSLARMAQVAAAPASKAAPATPAQGSGYRVEVQPDPDRTNQKVNAWVQPLDGTSASSQDLEYVKDWLTEPAVRAQFPLDDVDLIPSAIEPVAAHAAAEAVGSAAAPVAGPSTEVTVPPPTPAPEGEPAVGSGLQRISHYIPTEVLATYIALIGLTTPSAASDADLPLKWVLFGGGIFLIVAYLVLTYLLKNKGIRHRAATDATAKNAAASNLTVAGAQCRAMSPQPGPDEAAEGTSAGLGTGRPSSSGTPGPGAVGTAGSGADDPQTRRRRFAWTVGFAVVSFTVYAMAIPASPFEQFTPQLGMWGGGLALVLALLMPMVADLVDLEGASEPGTA